MPLSEMLPENNLEYRNNMTVVINQIWRKINILSLQSAVRALPEPGARHYARYRYGLLLWKKAGGDRLCRPGGSCVWEPCWLSNLDVLEACLSRADLISWGVWCEVQMFCFSGWTSRFWVLSNCGSLWWGWKVKVLVTQSCPTLCNPVDCSPPGPFIHGILQARIPEGVAIPLLRGSSQPRDWTQVCCIAGRFFSSWATREAQEYWSE